MVIGAWGWRSPHPAPPASASARTKTRERTAGIILRLYLRRASVRPLDVLRRDGPAIGHHLDRADAESVAARRARARRRDRRLELGDPAIHLVVQRVGRRGHDVRDDVVERAAEPRPGALCCRA